MNRSAADTRMEPGWGFHRRALKQWGAEAGADEARSYFQLSLLNPFWESPKPERVGRGRERPEELSPSLQAGLFLGRLMLSF